MKVSVVWSETDRVATIFHEDFVLKTSEDVAQWRRSVHESLSEIVKRAGGKVPLLVCIDGTHIAPEVAAEYGAEVKVIVESYVSKIARYGDRTTTHAVIAKEALKHGYQANLFPSREEALRHLLA